MSSTTDLLKERDGENVVQPTIVAYAAYPANVAPPPAVHVNAGDRTMGETPIANTSSEDAPLSNKYNPGCCPDMRPIPGLIQTSFVCFLILGILECFATFFINQIDSADVIIATSYQHWEEYAAIGWNNMAIVTTSSNGYGGVTTFNYDNRCNTNDCEWCIVVDWCQLETKGNEWYFGSWIRIGMASILFLLCVLMTLKMKCGFKNGNNINNNNYDVYNLLNLTPKQIKQRFYRHNKWSMVLYDLCLLIWAIGGIVSVSLWNDNNPINNFESVYWSLGSYAAIAESFVAFIFLLCAIAEFWGNR